MQNVRLSANATRVPHKGHGYTPSHAGRSQAASLALPQRLAVGCLGAAWVVNATGHAPAVARMAASRGR